MPAFDPFGQLLQTQMMIDQDKFQRQKYDDMIARQMEQDALVAQDRMMQQNAAGALGGQIQLREDAFNNAGPQLPGAQPEFNLREMITDAIKTGGENPYLAQTLGQQAALYPETTAKTPTYKEREVPLADEYWQKEALQPDQTWVPFGEKYKKRSGTTIHTGDTASKLPEEALRSIKELEPEANTAAGTVRSLGQVVSLLNQHGDDITGWAGGLKRMLAKPLSLIGKTPESFTDAELLKTITSKTAGSMRMEVVGPGPVTEWEQGILQMVSGGKLSAAEGVRRIVEGNIVEQSKKIRRYNNKITGLSNIPGYELTPTVFSPIDVGEMGDLYDPYADNELQDTIKNNPFSGFKVVGVREK